jgi:chromosomal replication initiation ATPase DnaA
MSIREKNRSLDELNEMYVQTYRSLGIDRVYEILKNYYQADRKQIIQYHASMLVCREFNIMSINELFKSKKRGVRTQALMCLYIIFERKGIVNEVVDFQNITGMPYHSCYCIKSLVKKLDLNLITDKKFMDRVNKINKELDDFIENFLNKQFD